MRLATFCVAVMLSLAFVLPASALTGTWTGTYTINIRCDANTFSSNGAAVFSSIGHPEGFTGFVLLRNVTAPVDSCDQGTQIPMSILIHGQVSGNTVSGEAIVALGDATFNGTLNGNALNGSFSGEDVSGTFSLTQTSTAEPDMSYSGTYAGSYSVDEDYSGECTNLGRLTYGGATEIQVFHIGGGALATGAIQNMKFVQNDGGTCTVIDIPEGAFFLSMAIDGSSYVSLGLASNADDILVFSGTISPTTMTGLSEQDGDKITFTATRTATTPPPVVTSFRADPQQIAAGASSVLTWSTTNATSVTIDNGVGPQPANGSVTVSPAQTTTYHLVAQGPGGNASAQVQVVVAAAAAPRIALTSRPPRFVQRAGQGGGSDSFTVSNLGNAPGTITLTPNDSFFTVSPASIAIPAGGSQTFTVTGTPQAAGSYSGTIGVSGSGVPAGAEIPVRMLSVAPATGAVQPRPNVSRAEISTSPGQPGSGSVSFTNHGTGTLQAMAVSDVPWIEPESGVVTIGPGQTRSVTFTVDPSKRPASASIGAVAGKLSIVFLRDSTSAVGPSIMGNGPATSTVSVTLVHVVRPGVVPGGPPPLAAGELAYFVSGMANKPTATGDLYVANSAAGAISDLKLYLLGAGGVAQNTSLPTLQPNSTVALPGLVKNVFTAPVATGSTQVRSSNTASVTILATQTNTSSPVGTFSTSLPIFRSDRGTAPAASVLLSGLLKSSAARTDLFIQEVSGTAGSFQVEYLNSAGAVIGTTSTQSLSPFASAELIDAVPSGAAAARVRNVSPSSSNLAAYALVTNIATGDAWLSTDPATDDPTATTSIVPLFSAGTSAETTLFMTNRLTSTTSVTVDVRSGAPSRRRAAGRTGTNATADATSSLTLAASQTSSLPITETNGYIRLTANAGALSAVARSTRSGSGANETFGTGLRAVPATLSLANGQLRRFSAVDDASATSRASAVPATFRTSLALVETANQTVTVRVTLNYTFTASLVSAQATSFKEYTLAPSQHLLLANLARDVIGPQRDSFGDLRDMTVDVQVMSGSGRVLPFLHSIDNGSGDSIVRTE